MTGRWGIFGGLFDPVHNGHTHLASALMAADSLDGVLWVPSASPPHKEKSQPVGFAKRVAMLELVLDARPNMKISQIELEQKLSGYALHTVRELKKRYPQTEFCFIIGADNIDDLANWYQYETLLSEIRVIAGSRGGIEPELSPDNQIRYYEVEPMLIASSDIRKLIQSGASSDELLRLIPEPVLDYILKQGLYL